MASIRYHQSSSSKQGSFEPLRQQPSVVILVGKPGCGKSTFCSKLDPSQWVVINQDTMGNRKECERAAQAALAQGRKIVIDRTNIDPTQRAHWVRHTRASEVTTISSSSDGDPSHLLNGDTKEHKVIWCIELDISEQECIRRCETRLNHPTVKPQDARKILGFFRKGYVPPALHEGFDCYVRIAQNDQMLYDQVVGALQSSTTPEQHQINPN